MAILPWTEQRFSWSATRFCTTFGVSYRIESLSQLDGALALDFRNKTVPIYLLSGSAEKRAQSYLLQTAIHNYIYPRWFHPYRTDIECGQFVAKVVPFFNDPDTEDEDSAVDLAMRMHTIINNRLDSIEAPQFYTTRPLFRAMAIIIPGQNYHTCGMVFRIATMPVLIVLTGEDEGLSAPISLDSIADKAEVIMVDGKSGVRTDLETAIGFVMFLEEREDAAFGPQPDPVASTAYRRIDAEGGYPLYEGEEYKAGRLGWNEGPLVGPSSQWVDMDKYPDWTGYGARTNALVTMWRERNAWSWHARDCTCIDSAIHGPRGSELTGRGR
ncbi:hypothetical protein ACJ41O_007313 [Fusarium nematophilum]